MVRARRADARTAVLVAYLETEGWLARRGRGRAVGQTVEEFAHHCDDANLAAKLRPFAILFSRVRYGGAAPTSDEVATAVAAFAAITERQRA